MKDENTKYEFFNIVLRLHRNLLLNRGVGKMTVGISVIFFVILLITGIVLWWPKNKNAARQRYWFRWKRSTQWKRKNYDLHNIPGFYSLFILLLIALTGLVFSFDWFEEGVKWIANGGEQTPKPKPLYSDTLQSGTLLPLDHILAEATRLNPEAYSISISLPDNRDDVVQVTLSDDAFHYTRERYQFDQYTGKLLQKFVFDDKNAGEKLKSMNYDIHVGSILGLSGKFLAFFSSLISASLPITGLMIWFGRRKKEKKASLKAKKGIKSSSKPKIQRHAKQQNFSKLGGKILKETSIDKR